jgi:hypothetical protein
MRPEIKRRIMEAAKGIAANMQNRQAQLEREQQELEKQIAEIKAKRDATRGAPDRVVNFQVSIGPWRQCPRCWIEEYRRSNLSEVNRGGPSDAFRCDACGWDIEI